MDNAIKQILEDLYKIDASLRPREKELIEVINKFIASRPDTKFDRAFAKKLRQELLAQFGIQRETYPIWKTAIDFVAGKKLIFAASGALVLFLVALPIVYFTFGKSTSLSFEQKISSTKSHAFGDLASESAASGSNAQTLSATRSATDSAGIGGGAKAVSVSVSESSSGMAVSAPSVSAIYRPSYTQYTFKYDGDEVELSDTEVKVIKFVKSGELAKKFSGFLGNINLGFINLAKFSNIKVDTIAFSEDKKYGFSTYINPSEESISISKNWSQWQSQNVGCAASSEGGKTVSCLRPASELTESDLLSDGEIIAIADKFISDYGINKSVYGTPEVEKSWKQYYTMSKYIPSEMTVIYPLKLDGVIVYDEVGEKYGLRVLVDIKEKRPAGVYNLYTQNYTGSKYDAVTDWSAVKKLAEDGGSSFYNYYWYDNSGSSVKTQELKLGTPTFAYVLKRQYNSDNTVDMLFIPSLVFEIENAPDNYYGQSAITVPLVKDIFDETVKSKSSSDDSSGGGSIEPMPMIETKSSQ